MSRDPDFYKLNCINEARRPGPSQAESEPNLLTPAKGDT